MATQAQGQFTIIDYNDAITLTSYINSSKVKTQMYNPDNGSYTPNWSSSDPVVLTPSLFKAGGGTADLINTAQVTSVKWFASTAPTTQITTAGNYEISGKTLKIKGNVLAGLAGIDYTCEITYLDQTTNLSLVTKASITFSRVVNGGGIVDLVVTTPDGNVFKNTSVSTLTASAQLWRGSTIDTTQVTFTWYKMNPATVTDQGGGVGWEKVVTGSTSEDYKVATVNGANVLTIPASKVESYATFKCIAKDTDSTSNTYNKTFIDTASFIDNSDPLQVTIQSSGGDVFKNGVGQTKLTAIVYQSGVQLDVDGTAGRYTWTKYGSNSQPENFSGTSSPTKTGKSIDVTDKDVTVKATFICNVEI